MLFPEALVAHSQQAELVAAQSNNNNAQVSVTTDQQTHQQVPTNRVEFVQHHNIDMVNHVVTHCFLPGMLAVHRCCYSCT